MNINISKYSYALLLAPFIITACDNKSEPLPASVAPPNTVTFCVDNIPAGTAEGESIYLAGTMNGWNGGNDLSDLEKKPPLPLQPGGEQCQYKIDVPFNKIGDVHQFKFTRGSWDSEELDENGYAIHNRRVIFDDKNNTLHFSIKKWKDLEGGVKEKPSTLVGKVETQVFSTPQLTTAQRTVRIYLPAGYDQNNESYPVLYMFDGQNLFDEITAGYGMEWQIDETLEKLVSEGKTKGAIVVGIDSPNKNDDTELNPEVNGEYKKARYREYTAWEWDLPGTGHIDPLGEETSDFIAGVVMPYIENNYRVNISRETTALAGSSMGGYMTLYIGTRLKERFSKLMAFSVVAQDDPMHGYELRTYIEQNSDPINYPTRIYMDMGTQERLAYAPEPEMLIEGMQAMCSSLKKAGHSDVSCPLISGALHDEISWSERFADVYMATMER
ncbi:alpha/beta hydrolase-fold protein [Serratia oryzae]|uniref:alpha/beta hydrolase-fold protein n=1 Tax=Serratia oryzae TaxID=2034155 RepID=UPI0012E0D906|nr:alpha/beta hydrolase-fold protein [Serratia oryzae]